MEEYIRIYDPLHRDLAKTQMMRDAEEVQLSTSDVKLREYTLSSLRKIPMVNENKNHLDSLKLFNRLISFAQQDMTVETSLHYELISFPLSLFSNRYQKMTKANKADFSKTSQNALTGPLDPNSQPCCTLVIDGRWLLWMVKGEPDRKSPTVI